MPQSHSLFFHCLPLEISSDGRDGQSEVSLFIAGLVQQYLVLTSYGLTVLQLVLSILKIFFISEMI